MRSLLHFTGYLKVFLLSLHVLVAVKGSALTFAQCVDFHNAGDLGQAESCYTQLIQTRGREVDVERIYFNYAQVLDSLQQPGKTLAALLAMRQTSALGDEKLTSAFFYASTKAGLENPNRRVGDTGWYGIISLRQWLSASEVSFVLSIVFLLAGLFLLGGFYFSGSRNQSLFKTRWGQLSVFIYSLFLVVGWSFLRLQSRLSDWGAVSAKTADVYSGPNPVVFSLITQLPEGTLIKKVNGKEIDRREGWILIADRAVELGWVRENEVSFLGL